MNQLVILNSQEQEQLVRAIESAVHVRRRHQLFLWAQGQFCALLPHEILICLRLEHGNGATHVECLHTQLFDKEQEDRLCHPHDGLAVRLALACEENGCLPGLVAAGVSRHARIYETFRDDLEKAGLRNAVVHGDRINAHNDAFFFILLNVNEVAPVQGHLMKLMLPHMHLAFNHVISQDRGNRSEAGEANEAGAAGAAGEANEADEAAASPSISDRELQVLKWICSGKSNYEIGVILNISPLTVKNHVQKIFRKLNIHNRAQAVSRAMSLKLFQTAN
jgi:transcriptional regulator EpsA